MPPDPELTLDSKRKETLHEFLEVLREVVARDSATVEGKPQESTDKEKQYPVSSEEKRVLEGIETFDNFEKRVERLDKELRNFDNGARQLGSSAALLLAASRLRERLVRLLFIFRDNTANLFPRRIARQSREMLVNPNIMDRRGKAHHEALEFQAFIAGDGLATEAIPQEFEGFARDLRMLLHSLNDFPEFRDDAVNNSIHAFIAELEYRASCLTEYKGHFRLASVQQYVHGLTTEIGSHIDVVASNLSMFIDVGVPTIQLSQQYAASNLSNLATFGTIFSIVTATLLQLSYHNANTGLAISVNAFWFSSLVFSVTAIATSLLGLAWTQAIHRSPNHRVPWWLLTWIRRSPLVLLVNAVMCFFVGLMLVTYAISDNLVTPILITIFATVTSIGLASSLCWIVSERFVYIYHQGHIWLEDLVLETIKHITAPIWMITHRLYSSFRGLPLYVRRPPPAISFERTTDDENVQSVAPTSCGVSIVSPSSHEDVVSIVSEATPEEQDEARRTRARERFKKAVRTVISMQSYPRTYGSQSLDWLLHPSPASHTPSVGGKAIRRYDLSTLSQKLRNLECTEDISPHQALVRDLQFSPDGKYLATASWDKTACIFKVAEPSADNHVLYHERGFTEQILWSSSGSHLLTRSPRGIKIWGKDGVCLKTIRRPHIVKFLQWVPLGDMSILSVEGNEIVKLDKDGEVLETYSFGRVQLRRIVVTSDGHRIIGIGPIGEAPNGLHPSRPARVEKRIIVYNTRTGLCESQIPLFQDVNDVKMSRNNTHLLFSFGDQSPPQLWKMDLVGGRGRAPRNCARLTFRHTFSSPVSIEYVESTFGGKSDQFILCAGKAGDILIWDRESANLLHHIYPTNPDQDLTCISCNCLAGDPFAFAVGGHDGSIRIWSTFLCLTPVTPFHDPHDMTPPESLSSYSPRGWPTDRIPANSFLKVVTPTRRLRSPSMTSTAFLSRSNSGSAYGTQRSISQKSDT
ncbi:WD40-repeat-containing domain protein [Suillus americanus]|nr:WD40-repeat-containing domain protein [Suillus americanus]